MIYWSPPLFSALHGLHAIHTKHDKTMQSLMKTKKQTGSDDCTSTIIVDSRPAMIFFKLACHVLTNTSILLVNNQI